MTSTEIEIEDCKTADQWEDYAADVLATLDELGF